LAVQVIVISLAVTVVVYSISTCPGPAVWRKSQGWKEAILYFGEQRLASLADAGDRMGTGSHTARGGRIIGLDLVDDAITIVVDAVADLRSAGDGANRYP
jgi:hypothetical protein